MPAAKTRNGRTQPREASDPPRRSLRIGVLSLLASTAVASTILHPPAAVARPGGPLVPPAGALFGSYVKPTTGWTETDVKNAVSGLETDLGRKLDIDVHYYPWNSDFPTWQETWDITSGRTPLISWAGSSSTQINSGSQDAWIRARADEVKSLGKQVFVRWFPDMDIAANDPVTVSPAAFIAAWKRIVGIFDARGATNAVWTWCPSSDGFATGEAATYYPGDTWVDWICSGGFNWAPGRAGATWRPLDQIFNAFYQWGAARAKPLMISETGAQERWAGEKAAWIADARADLKASFPNILAFVYSHADSSFNWRANTSTGAYDAFKAMAKDPHFYRPASSAYGTLFGAYVQPQGGWSQAHVKASITKLESDLGRKFDIDHTYYQWGQAFPMWQESWDLDNGRIPFLHWGGTNSNQINNGSQDVWIRARADAIKALGKKVMINYFAEMDESRHDATTVTPAAFINAWRRIVGIFRNRGATNVEWVWCATGWGFTTGEAATYYPGDAYVDWPCADAFNWAPNRDGAAWRSFVDIFKPFYTWASPKGKPLMVAETGTAEDTIAGRKAQWITDARNTIKNTYPNIKAFVYFSSKTTDGYDVLYDWRVTSSATSLDAYKKMGADAFFKPSHDAILGL